MQKKDFVSLAEARPDLAAEWNYEKNENLRPDDVGAHSSKKVWWKLPYDVPMDYKVEKLRGKHFEFEWETTVNNRSRGNGCPYLNGQKVWPGFNDLQTLNPELAKQWHPTKNGNLKPTDVAAYSKKKVWWLLPYDNIKTRKHFDFEWKATISNRNKGFGCPYLNGTAVWPGFNDLQTLNPELARQWHPTKNGSLKPTDVTINSNKKVWWLLHYKDPKTQKYLRFEWKAIISSRNDGKGCPYLAGKITLSHFNDLETLNPELARQWHPTKNGSLKPTDVTIKSGKKVWWLLPYDDPKTRKHFDFEWKAAVSDRNNGKNCPYLSGKAVWPGFNDLETLNPELARQWHPIKNRNLKPIDVTISSNKKVWWLLPYDDPKTGKHFDFEWQDSVSHRNNSRGCPYISGHAVWPGFNDLETLNPELAKQWHPTKNGNLKPTDVTIGSGKNVWWLLSYDDPKTGKHFNFEWKSIIANRNKDTDCPYISGRAVWRGFNDLETVNPELAKQWHPIKNGDLKPIDITISSGKKVWWLLPYDDPKTGKHFNFEWEAAVSNRNKGVGCPYLMNRAVWKGFNDLETVNPELAKQWHPIKNADLKPNQVVSGSTKKVWWLLCYHDTKTNQYLNFEWKTSIVNRNKGAGCPYLTIYKGEEYIKQYLQKNNITFTSQQKFPDLIGTGGGQLSYDFSIPSEKYGLILIEYNGIQHYESSEFFGGEEKFKKQKEHDRLKKEYAKKHGYKLIVVKYTYDTYEDVAEYLEKELKKSDESVFTEMKGEDIKIAEKEVIKEFAEKNEEKIGKMKEEAVESIVCNKEENVT